MQSIVHERAVPRSADAVALAGVVKQLGGTRVLNGIDLELRAGERVGIVGRSGAGKSTLLSLVAGLDEPDDGQVAVGGARSAAARLERCALMPQRDCLLPWSTALDNACLALRNAGASRNEARAIAAPLFERLGLGGSERLLPAQLSGGMRQRVAFLRTLLAGKDVLLLDEPFGALDAITRSELHAWLASALDDEPRTVLLVTHDVEEALLLCERVLVLEGGRIAAEIDAHLHEGVTVTSPELVALRERTLEALQ